MINVQAASASRFGGKYPAEYNIYEIDDGVLKSINRHISDPDSNGFTDVGAYDHRTTLAPSGL